MLGDELLIGEVSIVTTKDKSRAKTFSIGSTSPGTLVRRGALPDNLVDIITKIMNVVVVLATTSHTNVKSTKF